MPEIAIVGEAWGRDEEEARAPFVGPSGRLLNQMLGHAGIPRRECYVTNVFNLRPKPTNDISNLCGPRTTALPGYPPLASGKYIRAEFKPEIERLDRELRAVNPNLIIAFGGTPLTVLTKLKLSISKNRGNIFETPYGKLLATYHPAAVLREWSLRPIVIADLIKAKREAETREFSRPSRTLWIEPTLEDLYRFYRQYILPRADEPWGIDIETAKGTITEIGFARPDVGLVIPFLQRPNRNYWPSHGAELSAWGFVKLYLDALTLPVFQNGLYDLNYLFRMGITVPKAGHDTMLLQHALQPEMKKGLGFLGSLYTREPSWKMMRQSNETLKREDD